MSTLKRKAATQAAGADAKKPKQNSSIMSFFGPPKVTPSAASSSSSTAATTTGANAGPEPAAPKFDKVKWVASLTPEQRELLQLEITTLHHSWLALLKDEITTKEFLDLKRFLNRETAAGKKWFPPKEDVYSWSRHTPFNNVKVVIVGQDPYHNHNQAHGLAFSVRPPTPAPPSLKNMYTCLKNDYPSFTPPPNKGGLLTPWAERGVLMLNTCLTVRVHEANSHSNRGWERFTQRVIDLVATKRTRGVVFMAWGTPAAKRVQKVDAKRHLVLKAVHPSPLSASRGYFTCRHFRLANDWLATRYGDDTGPVDWALTEGASIFAKEGEDDEAAEHSDAVSDSSVAKKVLEDAAAAAVDKKPNTSGKTNKKAASVAKSTAAEDDENVAPEEDDVEA
ncbi:uracil-DNA glycosylase-like protein [Lasiosphaeria miniovina]|uniref:Uracil-DNA glycosylase n=1 Tax=Lasiosphaeria miniovina TaxID=1954250 RepID=A0AA40EAI0_9PEZI|nr:uracil-DNA glycosylase-like protein [Lasiosphaeria miniovina]KAK0734419.1 uracil-DNA glycosylase-like protein [Lasiosphaeria miniovina]